MGKALRHKIQNVPENVPECSRMFQKMFQNVSQNVPKCSKMFQNVPECSRIFQNVPECSRMFQNVPECMQNVLECSRMLAKCSRMHAECSRMFQNAGDRNKTIANLEKLFAEDFGNGNIKREDIADFVDITYNCAWARLIFAVFGLVSYSCLIYSAIKRSMRMLIPIFAFIPVNFVFVVIVCIVLGENSPFGATYTALLVIAAIIYTLVAIPQWIVIDRYGFSLEDDYAETDNELSQKKETNL